MEANKETLLMKEWWAKKRLRYNIGFIISGFIAFIGYVILGSILIAPHDVEFEITLFTLFFQFILFLIIIGIANLFYNLGYYVDKRFNKKNDLVFRQKLFNLGFCFSIALPFIIPISVLIEYFVRYNLLKN
jgi:hypothetical protein